MQQGGDLSWFLFFAVGLATTVVLVPIFAHNQAQAALNERLRELAGKHHGALYPGGALEDPRVRLSLAGQTALLQFMRHGKNDCRTQLAIS